MTEGTGTRHRLLKCPGPVLGLGAQLGCADASPGMSLTVACWQTPTPVADSAIPNN